MKNWIEKYKSLAFPIDERFVGLRGFYRKKISGNVEQLPNQLQIEESERIKFKYLPKKMYKYRSFDIKGYSLNNLIENTMWLSNPKDFNDPFDSILHSHSIEYITDNFNFIEQFENLIDSKALNKLKKIDLVKNLLDLRKQGDDLKDLVFLYKLWMKEMPEQNDRIINEIKEIIESNCCSIVWESFVTSTKVMYENLNISVFKNEINRRLFKVACLSEVNNSVLMWSHYTDSHSGFCIEYDISALTVTDEFVYNIYPVFYEDIEENSNEDTLSGIKQYRLYSMLRKSLKWEYEREFRLIFDNSIDSNYRMPKISAIYVSFNIRSKNYYEIKKICNTYAIKLYKAIKSYNNQKMHFEEIS